MQVGSDSLGLSTYLDLPTNIKVIGKVGFQSWKILPAYEGQEGFPKPI